MRRTVCMFQNICSCLFIGITTVCQDTCLIQIGVDLLIDVVPVCASRNLGYRQCLMFTANREPRSFSLWLGVFTPYKKKSAGSVRPIWAGQGCWHELQTKTTCAQGTKIIYRWSIAQVPFLCQGIGVLCNKNICPLYGTRYLLRIC